MMHLKQRSIISLSAAAMGLMASYFTALPPDTPQGAVSLAVSGEPLPPHLLATPTLGVVKGIVATSHLGFKDHFDGRKLSFNEQSHLQENRTRLQLAQKVSSVAPQCVEPISSGANGESLNSKGQRSGLFMRDVPGWTFEGLGLVWSPNCSNQDWMKALSVMTADTAAASEQRTVHEMRTLIERLLLAKIFKNPSPQDAQLASHILSLYKIDAKAFSDLHLVVIDEEIARLPTSETDKRFSEQDLKELLPVREGIVIAREILKKSAPHRVTQQVKDLELQVAQLEKRDL